MTVQQGMGAALGKPITLEGEVEGQLLRSRLACSTHRVPGQPGLYRETLPHNKTEENTHQDSEYQETSDYHW